MAQALMLIIGGLFTSLVDFLLKFFTKRVVLGATAVAIFIGFTVLFITALTIIIEGIVVTMPQSVLIGMGWFIPSNAGACLSAYFAALTARWFYDKKTAIMKLTMATM